jgi:mRNA interferase MazF
MITQRGDIVLCDFPYTDRSGSKVRPALVVLDDAYQKLDQTVLAIISSSRTRFVGDASQLQVDGSHPDWAQSGLRIPSVIQCEFLAAVHKSLVSQKLGALSAATMQQINDCLKAALGIP